MAGWSSGWVEIPYNVFAFGFAHNLGTTDLVFSVYWSAVLPGQGTVSVEDIHANFGSKVEVLNENEINLTLMPDGFSGGLFRPSIGIPGYIKVVAISTVAGPAPSDPSNWSSGWFNNSTGLTNGGTYTFTHSLGTADLTATIWVADDASGTNAQEIRTYHNANGSAVYGATLTSVSNTNTTLQLLQDGWFSIDGTGNESIENWSGHYVKVVAISTGSSPEAAGTEVKFIEPYDITPVAGAWTKVDAQPAWANSNARTLVVKAETFDLDIGGNTDQSLKARTSADSTIEVDIITHAGTSATRTVASEQALIPCSEDGSFEYYWHRSSTNGVLRNFKVVGYVQRSPFLAGTGDLCKILSEDSGYQMFRNGLTMQWMSSPAFITESSQVVNFPIPFASKPFKVIASTRFPSAAVNTHETMQVVSWNSESVTILAQSITGNFSPVYADIIAVGIAEVTDCSGSTDPNDPSDPEGIKISQLTSAAELKDDDLFVISKENTGDLIYDISQKVTFSELSSELISKIPPAPVGSNFTFIDPVEIYSNNTFVTLPWTTKDLSAHIPEGATGCIINITYGITGPDDSVPAKTLLRAKSGGFVYTALYAGAWAGGDAIGGNSQGLYPINVETRSIDISIPVRSPNYQNVYLIGYF